MRSALLLYFAALVMTRLSGRVIAGLSAARPISPMVLPFVTAFISLIVVGIPAVTGLFLLDGDHPELIPRRKLGIGACLPLAALGMMLVCPVSLMENVLSALGARLTGAQGAAAEALPVQVFLPMAFASVVIAPLTEEFFFRGYLLSVFARAGRVQAAVMTALLFAVLHGITPAFPGYLLLGLVLAAVTMKTGSILAALIVHSLYNFALLLLSGLGLGGALMQLGFFSGAARLAGTVAAVYFFRRVWTAKVPHGQSGFWSSCRLNRDDAVEFLLAAALITVMLAASGAAAQKIAEKREAERLGLAACWTEEINV